MDHASVNFIVCCEKDELKLSLNNMTETVFHDATAKVEALSLFH